MSNDRDDKVHWLHHDALPENGALSAEGQEQNQIAMEAMREIAELPMGASAPCSKARSPWFDEMKLELISKGMSEWEAEEYLRTL